MYFVIIERNKKNVPSDEEITKAMKESNGEVTGIEGGVDKKTVSFAGVVAHSTFQNNLERVARGNKTSWNFTWADAAAGAEGRAEYAGASQSEDQSNGHRRGADGLGATQYEIDITMDESTLQKLQAGGFNLYAFKAVQTSVTGGAPLVWFRAGPKDYMPTTKVIWDVKYQAYISRNTIVPNGHIEASAARDIDLGQTFEALPDGTTEVINQGTRTAISIHNRREIEYACGISQYDSQGKANPMCAFPLYGGNLDVIAPIQKVLLMFATSPVNTGTVIFQAFSPGALIDLTSSNTRSVVYDINRNWKDNQQFNWVKLVDANAALVPLLVESLSESAGATVQPRALVYS
jgi:hypothetical protein